MNSVIDEAQNRADGSAVSLDYYLQWSWPEHIETALRRLLWICLVEAAEGFAGDREVPGRSNHTGYVRWLIATHPDSAPAVLDAMTGKATPELLERIAENPQTWPVTLARLACEPCAAVRIAVAEHPNTPPAILQMLSADSDPDVRYRLSENPLLPQHVRQNLLADDNPYVAARAAQTAQRLAPSAITRLEVPQQQHANRNKRIANCR